MTIKKTQAKTNENVIQQLMTFFNISFKSLKRLATWKKKHLLTRKKMPAMEDKKYPNLNI